MIKDKISTDNKKIKIIADKDINPLFKITKTQSTRLSIKPR